MGILTHLPISSLTQYFKHFITPFHTNNNEDTTSYVIIFYIDLQSYGLQLRT
jgi:hypothetical protein